MENNLDPNEITHTIPQTSASELYNPIVKDIQKDMLQTQEVYNTNSDSNDTKQVVELEETVENKQELNKLDINTNDVNNPFLYTSLQNKYNTPINIDITEDKYKLLNINPTLTRNNRIDKVRQYVAIGLKRANIINLLKEEGYDVSEPTVDKDIRLARDLPPLIENKQRTEIIDTEIAQLQHIINISMNSRKQQDIDNMFKAMELLNTLVGVSKPIPGENNIHINTGTVVQLPMHENKSDIKYETIEIDKQG